jgi:hypothetical protein
MGVCTTNTERTNASSARCLAIWPVLQVRIDIERAVINIQIVAGVFIIQAGRELLVIKGQRSLNETGDTGGAIQMADIWFDGTNGTKLLLLSSRQARSRSHGFPYS